MVEAKRDKNSVPTLIGVSSVDGITPVTIYVDPVTHRVLTSTIGSAHNFLSSTHTDTVAANPVLGDLVYGSATPKWTKLAGNATATKKFLTQTGDGAVSGVPAWDTLIAGDIPDLSAVYEAAGVAAGLITTHAALITGVHGLIITAGKTITATESTTLGGGTHSGTNTGDETTATIKTKLGITTLSGSNTGDDATPAETAATIGALIGGADDATPNNGDFVATSLTAGGVLKKITWTNVKAFLKTYFDTLYLTATSTSTLTNKRITARVATFSTDATPDVNSDNYDVVTITAQEAAITDVNVTGTPTNFQVLKFRIKDDGTARAITWGADFEDAGVALPTTTVISKLLTVGFIYNTVTSKWGCVAVANET